MDNFVRIAKGLDVGPALAELARQPQYWLQLGADALRYVPLLGCRDERQLTNELPAVWQLIDTALAIAAETHGDRGTLNHARVGLMPPGSGLPPHFDGIDGVVARRYQLALVSDPGVTLTVNGESKRPLPGEIWQIDASRIHSVVNAGTTDRITILFDTQA